MATPVSTPPSKFSIPYVRDDVHSLLMWEDPVKSGIVFGGITALFLLLNFSGLSLITMLAYAVGCATIFFSLWAKVGPSMNRPLPELPAVLREGVSEADWKRYADVTKPYVDKAVGYVYSLVVCKDLVFSLKVIGASFAIGKVFAMFPVFAIAYAAVVVAFVAPKVYEQNQAKIDDALAKAKVEATKVYGKVKDQVVQTVHKVPPLAKVLGQKTA